jgi:hypothetical protein
MKTSYRFHIRFKQNYYEYHTGIRIHHYFSFFINNFPIFDITKFDDPHEDYWEDLYITLCFFEFGIYKIDKRLERKFKKEN